ncbi:MAG: hypothetical protein ASARMPRED_001694 [Alectoria sarmentosa]|nr:MAG: hypothetical protein ASARMPRED_001694 [Alectoria sarmentosa]
MFRIFENAVTPSNRLGSQQSPVSTNVHPTRIPASIKIYEENTLWLTGIVDSSRHDPTSVPKVFRPRTLVETIITPSTPRDNPYVAEPSPTDLHHRGLGPLLSKLPAEIRNIIYADLLSSGHPHFLRASKATHAEGSGLVAEHGRYRLRFAFPGTINHPLPSQRVVDAIRNLDIRADASEIGKLPLTRKEVPDLWLLRAFGGSGIVRGQCDVEFQVHPHTSNICVHRICRCLRLLSDFETVAVRVEIGGRDPVSATRKGPAKFSRGCLGAVWAVAPRDNSPPPVCWSESHLEYIYAWVRRELEWFLGKGHLGRDEVGLRLVFHPRAALEGVGNGWQVERAGGR